MATEKNGFLEYLQLQGGDPDLVTKSELIAAVRDAGFRLSDRQLTFYASEDLLPRSVRVGSRAGAYPTIVVELMMWILGAREQGTSIEALRELLPVWKSLMLSRREGRLDLAELEYIARQHVNSTEAAVSVPAVISRVMRDCCPDCLGSIAIHYKDGTSKQLNDSDATISFAIARTPDVGPDDEQPEPQWYASTRMTLATTTHPSTDPTTVLLGIKPNGSLPPDPSRRVHSTSGGQQTLTSLLD